MNRVRQYYVKCNLEADGVVIDQNLWTDDESQAVQFYKEFKQSKAPIFAVVLKRWNGKEYVQMAFESTAA